MFIEINIFKGEETNTPGFIFFLRITQAHIWQKKQKALWKNWISELELPYSVH